MAKNPQKKSRIIVAGDSYKIAFLLAANTLKLRTKEQSPPGAWTQGKTLYTELEVGSTYVAAVIKYLLKSNGSQLGRYKSKAYPGSLLVKRLFNLGVQNPAPDKKEPPLVKWDGMEQPLWTPQKAARKSTRNTPSMNPGGNDVFVERICDPGMLDLSGGKNISASAGNAPSRTASAGSLKCRVHIQIGSLHPNLPVVKAAEIRCIIASLGDFCGDRRIRKSLSYESVMADVLRALRGYGSSPKIEKLFDLVMGTKDGAVDKNGPGQIYLMVRINHAALLLYSWTPFRGRREFESLQKRRQSVRDSVMKSRETARLIYHESIPAPVEDIALGRMDGFSGFLAANIALDARTNRGSLSRNKKMPDWFLNAVKKGVFWQVAHIHRGLLQLLFKNNNPRHKDGEWAPITAAQDDWDSRQDYFHDLEQSLKLEEWLKDGKLSRKVQEISIDIPNAVSHRTQWFLAGDRIAFEKYGKDQQSEFHIKAVGWLTRTEAKPRDELPLVAIGELNLMDRREVEDYLAIRDAFQNYGRADSSRPLNIAVFGAPGAGKSFGVKQVALHIAKSDKRFSKEDPLTFNLSQFSSLGDLVNAFHLVRNKCLKGPTPLFFWDEFDSPFDGRPFGWFKYFLAPMQDGEFTDKGTNYQLGKCVFVFAGGVNRSFEELNGRLRNSSFVEAKGPDFISRLRAHLNIRGINRPEDEDDQGRYVLRRAIMLHGMLERRLKLPNGELPSQGFLHPLVAEAFCSVPSFRHGARSMETILDMCDLKPGRRVGPSDLPSKAQLDMHVDASAFMQFIYPDAGKPQENPAPVRLNLL